MILPHLIKCICNIYKLTRSREKWSRDKNRHFGKKKEIETYSKRKPKFGVIGLTA